MRMLHFVAGMLALAVFALVFSLAATAEAQEAAGIAAEPPAAAAQLPSLATVRWADAAATFEGLRGKTVVVLVYATWCPKCNAWSADFFAQLKAAIAGKPVVVLAINADKSPMGIGPYVTERNFFAPNVLHGYDPTMVQRLGFQSDLFRYVRIDPSGAMVERGSAGSFLDRPEG